MKKYLILNCLVIIFLQSLDVITTSVAINLGATELNPLVSLMVDNIIFFVLFKIFIVSIILPSMFYLERNCKKHYIQMLWFHHSIMLLAVINNIINIVLLK